MSSPGFLKASRIIAAKDLRLEWTTWETLSASGVFACIVLVVFSFAFDLATVRELGADRLVPGVLWAVIAFASILGFVRSFQLEQVRGGLDALKTSPIDRGAVFMGKAAANWIKLLLLLALVIPLSAILFDYDLLASLGPLTLAVGLHSLGLTVLGTWFAAVAVRVGRGEALLGTLLLPAATPLLISAVEVTETVMQGSGLASVSQWILLAVGFDLLYLTLGLITFEFVLEE